MRQCGIYSCRRYPGRRCCADCEDRTCLERCENHPDRCRCWQEVSEIRAVPHRVTPEEEAEILRLLRDPSLSAREVMRRAGRSETLILRIAREHGLQRGAGACRKYDWDEIGRLYDEGLSRIEIAERMGCAIDTVCRILRKRGDERDDGN